MKKFFFILLAAAVILSFVACGGERYISDEEFLSHIEVIELTAENCADYFDIAEFDELDDFSEPTGNKSLGIKLKDEYVVLSDRIIVRVTGVESTVCKTKNKESGEWELSDPNAAPSTEEFTDDVKIYYSSDGYTPIVSTLTVYGDSMTESSLSDIKFTAVKGSIMLVDVEDDWWQTAENGIPYFRVGSKEYSTVVEDKPDDPLWVKMDLHKAAKYAMERRGITIPATE